MKLEHVAINVHAPHEMAEWYAKHLGLEIVRAQEVTPFAHFVADSARTSVLEFYNNPAAAVPDYSAVHPLMLHFAFLVDDMQADHARLLAAGATAFGEITTTAAGDQLAFVRDPWNVAIQLVTRRAPLL